MSARTKQKEASPVRGFAVLGWLVGLGMAVYGAAMAQTAAVVLGGVLIVLLQITVVIDRIAERRARPATRTQTRQRTTRRKTTAKTTHRRKAKAPKLPAGSFVYHVGGGNFEELDSAIQDYLHALYAAKQPHPLAGEIWFAPDDEREEWQLFPAAHELPVPPQFPTAPAYYPPRRPVIPTPAYPDYRPHTNATGW